MRRSITQPRFGTYWSPASLRSACVRLSTASSVRTPSATATLSIPLVEAPIKAEGRCRPPSRSACGQPAVRSGRRPLYAGSGPNLRPAVVRRPQYSPPALQQYAPRVGPSATQVLRRCPCDRPRARTLHDGRRCDVARSLSVRPRQAVGSLDQPPRPLHCQRATSHRPRPPRTAVHRRPSAVLLLPRLRTAAHDARHSARKTPTSRNFSRNSQPGLTLTTSVRSRSRSRSPHGYQGRWRRPRAHRRRLRIVLSTGTLPPLRPPERFRVSQS